MFVRINGQRVCYVNCKGQSFWAAVHGKLLCKHILHQLRNEFKDFNTLYKILIYISKMQADVVY